MVEPAKAIEPVIRLAETEEDVTNIHRFLMIVAAPHLWGSVDVEKSLREVLRVVTTEAALMAIVDGMLVGTMGIIKPVWWYGNDEFLTDRWNFVLPQFHHTGVEKELMVWAKTIADDAGLRFINQGKLRAMKDDTGLMFPRVYTPDNHKEGASHVLRQ